MTCRESVEHLWVEYRDTRSDLARNALVEVYMPLVQKRAGLLSRRLPRNISVDDLCSAGYEGLIHSVEAFDVGRKATFETFCQKRVCGAMLDWLRAMSVHTRTVQTFLTRRRRVRSTLSAGYGRRASDEEVADEMRMRHSRFTYLSRIARHEQEVQMSVLCEGRGTGCRWDGDESPRELADPKQTSPASAIEMRLLLQKITHALSREERLIITLYYCEGLMLRDIGIVLGLSESRVSQMHTEIVKHLRTRLTDAHEDRQDGKHRRPDGKVRQPVALAQAQASAPAA